MPRQRITHFGIPDKYGPQPIVHPRANMRRRRGGSRRVPFPQPHPMMNPIAVNMPPIMGIPPPPINYPMLPMRMPIIGMGPMGMPLVGIPPMGMPLRMPLPNMMNSSQFSSIKLPEVGPPPFGPSSQMSSVPVGFSLGGIVNPSVVKV